MAKLSTILLFLGLVTAKDHFYLDDPVVFNEHETVKVSASIC